MRRRQVIAATGALLPLAGCLSSEPGEPPDDPQTTIDGTRDGTTTTQPPSFDGAQLEVLHAECATEDATQAAVSWKAAAVVVEGTIVGADACHVAELESVAYDEAARELRVVVEAVRRAGEDTGCAQCITAIDYRVRARFTDEVPERVVVDHRRGGETTTVADVTRS